MEKRIEQFALEDSKRFPDGPPKKFSYGTAGFRDKASLLDCVIFRAALISTLRSICARATIGMVLTASHNPECDNGIKFVDKNGEMLIPDWETVALKLGNVQNGGVLEAALSVISQFKLSSSDYQPKVVIAKDTRISGDHLKQLLVDGLKILNTQYTDHGLLTTPQLHYMVKTTNSATECGIATEDGYCRKLTRAFSALMPQNPSMKPVLVLDAANGVGAGRVTKLLDYIGHLIDIEVHNDGSSGRLNYMCGADFIKTSQCAPQGFPLVIDKTYVSFDGDADRIVFYFMNEETGKFKLLDGDKIACLMAMYIKETLKEINVDLNMSVIQTAYANGSSTKYLADVLGIPVTCTKTGVKYLQRRAQDFDIGIFFEANGHGTILFSDKSVATISEVLNNSSVGVACQEAATKLLNFIDLTNQTTGDAIADMLMVQAILTNKQWKCIDWDRLYTELPNRQSTVKIFDRSVVTTTDVERKCVTPLGLQAAIDKLVAQVNCGRSFVRPSGTEDIIRVYAEAKTQELANSLAISVSLKVFELAGGIGEIPQQK